MNLPLIIKSLYLLNGAAALLLYVPQIIKARKEGHSLSLLTFGGWFAGAMVTLLYACLFLKDPLVILISAGNLVGTGAIALLIVRSRFSRSGMSCRT